MTRTLVMNDVVVKKSAVHGYGVFAKKDIALDEIIEECYGVDFECQGIRKCLNYYAFYGSDKNNIRRMLTGYGAIYNHSTHPNAEFFNDVKDNKIVIFVAIKPIRKGEEIFTSYGRSWFSERKIPIKKPPFWRRHSMQILMRTGLLIAVYLLFSHHVILLKHLKLLLVDY